MPRATSSPTPAIAPTEPAKYVKYLGECLEIYGQVLDMKAKLKKIEGLDRAKLLDQLVEAYDKLNNESDNVAGLGQRDHRAGHGQQGRAEEQVRVSRPAGRVRQAEGHGKLDEAKAAVEKAVAMTGISGEQKQDAYFAQGECFYMSKDFAGLVACLKKGVEAAPDSAKAANLKGMIARFAKQAEAQEAVAKLKADLEKATGLDRAKLLDRLIDAYARLDALVPGPNRSEELRSVPARSSRWTPTTRLG